jgi:hypothetical protein
MGREAASGIHSEHNLPGGKLQLKREMRIFGDRGNLLKKRIVSHSGLRSLLLLFPILP